MIAFRPDTQLDGLLGVADAGGTFANGYLRVDTSTEPGAGVTASDDAVPRDGGSVHPAGARAVATLYADAATATPNPAVTLRDVGPNGGQAAAFAYDLARSVVYTRQGNPAWAGQERDGVTGVRPNDLFYGASATGPAARLARHDEDRDPTGGRAAAAPRQLDHADGARPDAAAAVLVLPAATYERPS